MLTVTAFPNEIEPASNGNKGVLPIPQIPRVEPYHQMWFNIKNRTLNHCKYCCITLIILFNVIHSFAHT